MDFPRIKSLYALLGILFLFPWTAHAQDALTFENFFLEGSQQNSIYGDIGLVYSDFPGVNLVFIGGQLGIPIGEAFELGISLDFLNIDPQFGDDANGLIDPTFIGRYQVQQGQTDISVGAGLSLPLGDEDVGQGDGVDINIFGALRHQVNQALAFTGVLGIDFIDQFDDYDASLRLGGAVIFRTNPDLQFIGELSILSENDFALLNFGVDYRISDSSRLRPAIGLGVDNGAPDFVLALRLLFE